MWTIDTHQIWNIGIYASIYVRFFLLLKTKIAFIRKFANILLNRIQRRKTSSKVTLNILCLFFCVYKIVEQEKFIFNERKFPQAKSFRYASVRSVALFFLLVKWQNPMKNAVQI